MSLAEVRMEEIEDNKKQQAKEDQHVAELKKIITETQDKHDRVLFELQKANARIKAQEEKINELRTAKAFATDLIKNFVKHLDEIY